jgi:hypothetical protein
MEAHTPIALLKNRLAELKTFPGAAPDLIAAYEKAILVLEIITSNALDDAMNEPMMKNNADSNPNDPKKDPRSYFEKFMETQKNKK